MFGSETAFYEIAATLIPLFLLGGALIDRLKPGDVESDERVWWMTAVIPLVGIWGIFAEGIAISAAVSGNSDWLTRLIVVSALLAGMFAAVISLWWPWLSRAGKLHPSGKRAVAFWWVGFAVIFLLTTLLMEGAVSNQGSEEANNSTTEELNRVSEKLIATEGRIQSLGVERAKTYREFLLAMKPGVDCLSVRAFLEEEDAISRLLRREGDQLEALVIESGDLNKTLNGKAPTMRSPFPPTPKFKPRASLVPLKECVKHDEQEIREPR
jgi:hypothetical protein